MKKILAVICLSTFLYACSKVPDYSRIEVLEQGENSFNWVDNQSAQFSCDSAHFSNLTNTIRAYKTVNTTQYYFEIVIHVLDGSIYRFSHPVNLFKYKRPNSSAFVATEGSMGITYRGAKTISGGGTAYFQNAGVREEVVFAFRDLPIR
jgi:hypothetical protein